MRLEGLDKFKEIHLIGTRSRDLPACSIVRQPTTLPSSKWEQQEIERGSRINKGTDMTFQINKTNFVKNLKLLTGPEVDT
jgi:hypothetical protein